MEPRVKLAEGLPGVLGLCRWLAAQHAVEALRHMFRRRLDQLDYLPVVIGGHFERQSRYFLIQLVRDAVDLHGG